MMVGMGFPEARSAKAVQMTSNQGVEQALEWLMAHENGEDARQ